MDWFGNYFSKFPEDVSFLNTHAPLLLSLVSSKDEHFISNLRYEVGWFYPQLLLFGWNIKSTSSYKEPGKRKLGSERK